MSEFYNFNNGAMLIAAIQTHLRSELSTIFEVRRTVGLVQILAASGVSMAPDIQTLLDQDVKDVGLAAAPLRDALFRRFDGKPLSQRSLEFQQLVADQFIRDILPHESFESLESNPDDDRLSTIRAIFENEDTLQYFLSDPAAFLDETGQEADIVLEEEYRQQLVDSAEFPLPIYSLFDYAELGDSSGDGDTYILIGTGPDRGVPTAETFDWLKAALSEIYDVHGFTPCYGNYVTEAALRNRVILGPDVTDREADYVRNNTGFVVDRRGGEPIGNLDE